jgi:hypothetical protein
MIRPLTLLCALAALGSGLYLYQVKHRAEVMDREIHRTQDSAAALREHIGVLKTQYTLLSAPDRLAGLASQHLPGLRSTEPGQWTNMAELSRRLPPVSAAPVAPGPLEPDSAAPRAEPPKPDIARPVAAKTARPAAAVSTAQAAPSTAGPAAAAASPQQPASQTAANQPAAVQPPRAAIAVAKPPAKPAVLAVAKSVPATPAPPLQPASAAAMPPASPRFAAPSPAPMTPARLQTPGLTLAASHTAPRQDPYTTPQGPTAETIAAINRSTPMDSATPVVTSALGMARTMTQTPPFSPANTATLYTVGTSR